MAKKKPEIFDHVDRATEAQHLGRLYEILPADDLPGLYRRQRDVVLQYLEPAGGSLTPSQTAAKTALDALDDLLAAGEPDTDHKRQWRAQRQRAALLAWSRLNASSVERDKRRQEGTRKQRTTTPPAWHAKVKAHAAALLHGSGRQAHEITALCARKFGLHPDTVRPVLQDAGLVPRRKNRAQ